MGVVPGPLSKRARQWVLAVCALAAALSGTQTLAGRPIMPGHDLGLRWTEEPVRNGSRLAFTLGTGTVDAKLEVSVRAPVPTKSVDVRFDARPPLAWDQTVSRDRRTWALRIPPAPTDDTTSGLLRWVTGERLNLTLLCESRAFAGRLSVVDWTVSTETHQDSMRSGRVRGVLWWIYLALFLVSLVGIVFAILWEEQRAFTTEAVVRDLVGLVQGRNPADTKLIHQYLLDMIVSDLGYERSVERLGQGFGAGRSVAKRALEGFRRAAGPLYQQLRIAMEPPGRAPGTP